MSKTKNEWVICLKSIVLASLVALGVFLIASIVIAAVLAEIKNQVVRETALYVMIMVTYAVCFYRFHMYNRLSTYAEHTDKFDPKKELLAYIRAEGRILFVIYGIIAVVTELSKIMFNVPQNPIVFATTFCLGPWMSLEIPVLRSIIAFAYSAVIICLLTVLRSRKIHQEESLSKKR